MKEQRKEKKKEKKRRKKNSNGFFFFFPFFLNIPFFFRLDLRHLQLPSPYHFRRHRLPCFSSIASTVPFRFIIIILFSFHFSFLLFYLPLGHE